MDSAMHQTDFSYSEEFITAIAEYSGSKLEGRTDHLRLELQTKRQWMHWFFDACQPYMDFSGRSFLEVGCGTGYTSVAAAERGMQVEATDFVEKACELAGWRFREHGLSANVFVSDLRDVTKADQMGRYGFVFCSQVLEHIPRAGQFPALRHLLEMVAPEGFLYINTENSMYPYDRHDTKLPLIRLLSQVHAISLTKALGRSLDVAEASFGEAITIHDYLTYDEIVGAARVMGFEVVNPFMPYGTARSMLKVLTGSDWLYDNVAQYFDVERFLPVSVLLKRTE